MASRVGAVSTADVGRIVAEKRRKDQAAAAQAAAAASSSAPPPPPHREFELHYSISNNGDGSVSLAVHPSATAARRADEAEDEPFAEPTAGCLTLRMSVDGATIEVEGRRGTWVKLSPVAGPRS